MVNYTIALIPGDGIGVDVTRAAQQVLDAAAQAHGFTLDYDERDWSCNRYLKHGEMMPEDGLDSIKHHDAVYLGAVGFPTVPDHISLWGLLVPIRRDFKQYINQRPIKLFKGVRSPVNTASGGDVDFVIIRENSEGEYSDLGGRIHAGPHEIAIQETVFTRHAITRLADYGFHVAAERTGYLTSATKSNSIVHTMPFWDEIVDEAGLRAPDIRHDKEHIDALAAKLVLEPTRFDVILASNLFGDILSDLGAAISGSIGMAPSGNINPDGTFPSMFEPVHGSAPDIAGKGIANPIGAILTGAMMLNHLGEKDAAAQIDAAVATVLADTDVRTPDLGGTSSTSEVTDAVVRALATPETRALTAAL